MKIGIDVRTATDPRSGKGIYTYNLVKNLLKIDRKNEYLLYTNEISGDLAHFPNAHIKIIQRSSWRWHFAVVKDFMRERGDVFFAPTSYIIPTFLPRKIKSIITVHDLVAFLHPALHQIKATILEKLFFRLSLSRCAHVLTPSQNTKKDLMKFFKCADKKITVTPLGVSPEFFEKPKNMQAVKEKYNLPDEFILTISGFEPRKNVGVLIDAMDEVAQKSPKIKLVIVGGKGWKSTGLQKKISQKKHNVIHIENCPPRELSAFYHLAKVFVYPSLYEGFGLPPLEALASGCPVICSNTSSLPEVCGDAALMVDPDNKSELAHTLEELLKDESLSKSLHEKGSVQAKKFSWEATAEKTLAVLTQITTQKR